MFAEIQEILLEKTKLPLEVVKIIIEMMQPSSLINLILNEDLKTLQSIYFFRRELLLQNRLECYLFAIRYKKTKILDWFDQIKLNEALTSVRPRLRFLKSRRTTN